MTSLCVAISNTSNKSSCVQSTLLGPAQESRRLRRRPIGDECTTTATQIKQLAAFGLISRVFVLIMEALVARAPVNSVPTQKQSQKFNF